MAITYKDEIKCPCGEEFETEIVQSVSVAHNPELKEMILAGEFNVVQCPSCDKMLYAERFVLYHDASQELLAFVYPKATEQKNENMMAEMDKNFAEIQNDLSPDERFKYKPFLIFGLDSLCDLIKQEDEIADEVQIVDYICGQLKLKKQRVHQDSARRKNILPLLPIDSSSQEIELKELRTQTIAGLKKVLEMDDALEHYRRFLSQIESDNQWSLELSELIC